MGRRAGGQRKQRRWGLRTLAFLALAMASIITSSVLNSSGRDIPITLVGTLVGLGGAAYCTFRGIREANWLQR